MTRPRQHPHQSPAEHDAEVVRVRAMLAEEELHQLAGDVVRPDAACPECGQPVDEVNVETLAYERQSDGTLAASSIVIVALPCGDSFTRETSINAEQERTPGP
jgi:DNA repair exonuclease SbcCD ATPase subunit